MLDAELLALLVCPDTHLDVMLSTPDETKRLNEAIREGRVLTVVGEKAGEPVDAALIRIDRAVAYPIRDGIPVMLVPEGLLIADLNLAGAERRGTMSALTGKKLGVLLTTAPEHPNFRPALALMNAALEAGARVYLYCIDDGVQAVSAPEIQALKERGASLFGCAYGAHRRRLAIDDAAAWSGLTVLADVVGSTDRFVSF